MAELAEGARLLSEYGGYTPSRVRIPVSPPLIKNRVGSGFFLQTGSFSFKYQLVVTQIESKTNWELSVIRYNN